jgi:hypothetical protein
MIDRLLVENSTFVMPESNTNLTLYDDDISGSSMVIVARTLFAMIAFYFF